jgi:hypothetical protein
MEVAIIVAVLIAVVVVIINYTRQPSPTEVLNKLWQNGGLLYFTCPLNKLCRNYSSHCLNAKECDIVDIGDYNSIQPDSSCYSLATSFTAPGLAQICFGPWEGDMTVGIFLDPAIMKSYVACMTPLDSGSIGRYGNDADKRAAATITPDTIKNKYSELVDKCNIHGVCALKEAGCGSPYKFATAPYSVPYNNDKGQKQVPAGWSFGGMPLFDRDHWEDFVKTTADIQEVVGQQSTPEDKCKFVKPFGKNTSCNDYWSYQWEIQQNGYRETEVDIFVPQIGNCSPHPEFLNDFANAVVGVFAINQCSKDIRLAQPKDICCSLEFSQTLAARLAEKYNSIRPNHIIHAVTWNTDKPDEVWTSHNKLEVEIISAFKPGKS